MPEGLGYCGSEQKRSTGRRGGQELSVAKKDRRGRGTPAPETTDYLGNNGRADLAGDQPQEGGMMVWFNQGVSPQRVPTAHGQTVIASGTTICDQLTLITL
jgi:hypothetical protein